MPYFPQVLVTELISEEHSSTCEQELAAQVPYVAYRQAAEWLAARQAWGFVGMTLRKHH